MRYTQRNVPNASALLLAFAALLLLASPALLAVHADPINPNLSWSPNPISIGATTTATFGVGDTIPGTSPPQSDPDCPAGDTFTGTLTVTMPNGKTSSVTETAIPCGTQNLTAIYPTAFTSGSGAPSTNIAGTYTAEWKGTTTALVGGVHPAFDAIDSFFVQPPCVCVPEFSAPPVLVAAIGLVAVVLVKKANLIKVRK
jgi:hypothetical protein